MQFLSRPFVALALFAFGSVIPSLAQTPSTPPPGPQLKRTVDYLQTLGSAAAITGQSSPAGASLVYFGGPIIQHPVYHVVSWSASVDPAISPQVDQFLSTVGSSIDFNAVLNQYGGRNGTRIEVGTFAEHTIATPDPRNGGTPVTDDQIQSQLQTWISNGVLPQNTADSIYILLFPPGVKINTGGGNSCQQGGFCGYHGTINGANGQYIYYAVLPDFGIGSGCDVGCGRSSIELNNFTSVLSHEISEAITDPAVGLASTYSFPLGWYDRTYGEIGDICNAQQATLLGWTVQQEFSNAENNCVATRPNFSLKVTGDGNVPVSGVGSLTVNSLAVQNQTPQSITLFVSGLPTGVTGTFTPPVITAGQSSTLNLTANGSAVPGTVNATILGTADVTGHTISALITVTPKAAALTLTKTHSGSFTQGQAGATYTITVTNSGAQPTVGTVTVADVLPAGLIASSITGPAWNCTQPAGPCTRSDALTVGASYPSITVTVNVASNAPTSVVNIANASGGGAAPVSASDPTTIDSNQPPTLSIVKSHNGSFAQGKTGAYLVTVSNAAGVRSTTGVVTVTENLPAGLSLVSMTGQGWTCNGSTCTRSDALSAGNSYPGITVTVNVAANATSPQVNSVSVSGGGSVATSTTDSTIITSGPAIQVPATVTLNPGDQVPFVLTLSSPAPSGGVFVNLTIANPLLVGLNVTAVLIQEGQTSSSRAQLTGLAVGSTTVTASAGGFTSGIANVQIGSGPTGTLTLSPPSSSVSAPGTQNLTLTLSPAAPAGGLTVSVTSSNPLAGNVGTPVVVPANSNSATIPVTALAPGTATITVSAPNYSGASASVTVLGKLTITTASLANGQVGTQYAQSLTAAGGLGPYTWTLTAGTLPSQLGLNQSNGLIGGIPQAAIADTPLTFKVTDSSSPVQTASANFTLTITAAPTASSIQASSGTPQSAGINTQFASPLVALVKDNNGNPVNNVQVTFTAPSAGPSGTFAGGGATVSVPTNGAGLATAPIFTANATAGSFLVTASVGGVASPATFSLTNSPANSSPAIILPASVVINPGDQGVLSLTLSAPAPAGGVFITLSNSNPAVASLTTANIFISEGSSSSSSARVNGTAVGATTITAAASGYLSASTQVQVGGSLPLSISTTALPNAQVNKLYSQVLTATGGTLPYHWALTAGTLPSPLLFNILTGAITGTPTVSAANVPLTFQVTDSSTPAKTATVNLTLTISPAAIAASIVAVSGTQQTAGISSAFAAPLVALVKDSGGNPVGGAVVTFTVPASGPSASFAGGVTTATTNAAGLAMSAILTANATGGSYTVTASVPGAATPANFSLTNVSGPAILLPGTITLNPTDQSVFTLTLSAPAPAGGVFITLSSSNNLVALLNTINVFISEGQTSSTRARVTGVSAGTATITASASGYAPASSLVQVGTP